MGLPRVTQQAGGPAGLAARLQFLSKPKKITVRPSSSQMSRHTQREGEGTRASVSRAHLHPPSPRHDLVEQRTSLPNHQLTELTTFTLT